MKKPLTHIHLQKTLTKIHLQKTRVDNCIYHLDKVIENFTFFDDDDCPDEKRMRTVIEVKEILGLVSDGLDLQIDKLKQMEVQ
jgi:hypothetical protein